MTETSRLTRRKFLALGGAALATQFALPRNVFAQAAGTQRIRLGAVLPMPAGQGASQAQIYDVVGEAARMGAVMAGDEFSFQAELLGMQLEVLLANSPNAEAATRAAERLIETEGVCGFFGGFGKEQALALSQVAEKHRVPFLNIGAPSDSLRGELCNRYTFHVEASAAMYLDALVAWFVRAGHRRWFFVQEDTDEGAALYRRVVESITERHWGARDVGRVEVAPEQPSYHETFDAIRDAEPDVVLLLLNAEDQLNFLGQYEGAGIEARVTAFPDSVTQTRDFFARLHTIAPKAGAGYRASLWEATIDAYGARELNARFHGRWGVPMESASWSAYQAVKILYETVFGAATQDGDKMVEHLEAPHTVFDAWKGIGLSFRPWDHQLRQPIYLVKVNDDGEVGTDLEKRLGLATWVGELPEIYKPGTDPIERLDQLGDLEGATRCRF